MRYMPQAITVFLLPGFLLGGLLLRASAR